MVLTLDPKSVTNFEKYSKLSSNRLLTSCKINERISGVALPLVIKNLNKKRNNIEVLVSRLPKIKSDQTISLFETNAIPAFDAILPILNEISSNFK